jgi:undecaprenyl-diphosphatase
LIYQLYIQINGLNPDMSIFQSIILGIVQGITEFLPISSSAHLVIVPFLLKWEIPSETAFVFNILVQVASLVGVFVFFWRDIYRILHAMLSGIVSKKPFADQEARLGWYLILATVPAGLIGLFLKDQVEATFNSPTITAFFLLVTATLLVIAERVGKRNRDLERMEWKDSVLIGLFQAIAIFPGVSRSGSTITGGMVRDLERPPAARFAFLMSIPIMLAAGLVGGIDLLEVPNLSSILPILIPGFVVSAVVSFFAIGWLIRFLNRYPLYVFSVYCVGLSILTLLTAAYRG